MQDRNDKHMNDYIMAMRAVKASYIKKYGKRAEKWFGV